MLQFPRELSCGLQVPTSINFPASYFIYRHGPCRNRIPSPSINHAAWLIDGNNKNASKDPAALILS